MKVLALIAMVLILAGSTLAGDCDHDDCDGVNPCADCTCDDTAEEACNCEDDCSGDCGDCDATESCECETCEEIAKEEECGGNHNGCGGGGH